MAKQISMATALGAELGKHLMRWELLSARPFGDLRIDFVLAKANHGGGKLFVFGVNIMAGDTSAHLSDDLREKR